MKFKKSIAYLKSIQQLIRLPLMFTNGGFTLIEILVAVLIIGILAAIAVPQYQRALLKSRYAALMPIAKSMANSNEAYYLEHGIYADDPQDLLIQGQSHYTDDTELEFGTVSDYAYVLAKNEDKIPNNTFVVYQKHSGEFPGEIHCEALADNDLAESVCKSFGGNESIGKTLTDGYETYVLFGTGNGVAPTGDNGGDEPEEPQTPTCDGAAPSKQEACSSGCGSVTVTAECEEGEWVYPTADMSSCPVKPNDETVACDSGYTGNKTRTATCNSAGTAWEFTDNWNTSGCTAVPTCPAEEEPTQEELAQMQATARANSGVDKLTVTVQCGSDGEWKYVWTGGQIITGTCNGNAAYGCVGSMFTGYTSHCTGTAGRACADSTFSGTGSYCEGQVSTSCADSTFSGDNSYCNGRAANACSGSTFSGHFSYCDGRAANACTGAKILAGAVCSSVATGGCNGVLYGPHPDQDANLIGTCYDYNGSCPAGVPISTWNGSAGDYDFVGWKGDYCDPNYMVSGTCPAGSPKQGGGTW